MNNLKYIKLKSLSYSHRCNNDLKLFTRNNSMNCLFLRLIESINSIFNDKAHFIKNNLFSLKR